MKTFFITLSIFLSVTLNCYASEPKKWDNNLTTEQNIAANAIALKDSSDLSFLDKIARKKSIIILGEPGHYELKTSQAKINMISYLRKKGFNAIAMETAPFLSTYVFSNPEYVKQTKDWKFDYFWAQVWTDQKTCQPLIEQIQQRKINVLGIDGQLGMFDIVAAQILLEKYKKDFPLEMQWNNLYKYYLSRLVFYRSPQYYKPITKTEEFELMSMVNKISNHVRYIIAKKGNTTDLKALMQWVQNVKNAYPYTKYNMELVGMKTAADTTFLTYIERNREEMMAKNIIWYAINQPKTKFTVWCANSHASKDLSQVVIPYDSLLYFHTQTMGEFLDHSIINKRIYSLAITSKNLYKREEDGNLELEIANVIKNAPFAYIDFESLRFADGYWDQTFNAAIGRAHDGKYFYSYDGLYYLRDQELNDK